MQTRLNGIKVVSFILIVSVLLTACTSNKLEKANAKGDIERKIEEGNLDTGKNLAWPEELMVNIPNPNPNCKITAILKNDKSLQCTVAFSGLSEEDSKEYVRKLKSIGYSGGLELTDESGTIYGGQSSNGSTISYIYNITSKEGVITYLPKK